MIIAKREQTLQMKAKGKWKRIGKKGQALEEKNENAQKENNQYFSTTVLRVHFYFA